MMAPAHPSNLDTFDLLATLPDASLGATLVAGQSSATLVSPAATQRRCTVLPRVELASGAPTLVAEDRPRYEHVCRLGEGGMGEVVKAQDNDIGRAVAIKRLKPELRAAPVVARFAEEVRTVGQLEHPNIVPIHDVGVDERGDYYFVMKYFDGETMESIIEKLAAGDPLYHARYPFERRMQLFEGLLAALSYAHAHGIVHRDIKPANVMVGRYGEVMVMDWGIATRIDGTGAVPEGGLIGTPAYMSPEQARGETLDQRSDIYSACVLLHELLGLKHYLEGKATLEDIVAALRSPEPAPLAFAQHASQPVPPADLMWFVRKGLAVDASQRYQSVSEMIERLQRRREGWVPIQCPATFLKRVAGLWTRLVDTRPGLALFAAAGSIAIVAGLAWQALH